MNSNPEIRSKYGLAANAAAIQSSFERVPFIVRHDLCDHPLLQLPRLIELASVLPGSLVEFNNADIPLSQDYLKTPRNGLTIAETLHQIEQCHSWLVLKNVEHDPAYCKLLLECLEELRPFTAPIAPGICKPEAFIFVSSPQAVTPYHCDPEHNFLLQVRGSKRMAVFDRDDGAVVAQEQFEAIVNGAHRNLSFADTMHGREFMFSLTPGLGLHVPMHCPHWVRVDDSVSISLSITFRSRLCARREGVLRVNSRLRRRGFTPLMPGKKLVIDEFKYFSDRVISRLTLKS
jgi:hypothetical protein